MSIRLFDWRDLPTLHRYRNDCLFLDSTRLLTRGSMLIPAGALLSYLAPATGIFTFLLSNNGQTKDPVLAQVIHNHGCSLARLSFLAPESAVSSPDLHVLLDHLVASIGDRGAFHLLAEVEEHDEAFDTLRCSGFAIYARQRIWQLASETFTSALPDSWKMATSQDLAGVRFLYNNLVPGLVQQVEPPPVKHFRGLIYRQDNEVLAYVELKYGPRGIWAQPFIHPDAETSTTRLIQLLQNLPNRRSRPVYVCVRSYQSWLEPAIEDLGAEPGPRQAVMVKHLAITQKAVRSFVLPALEGRHPEISAPIIRRVTRKP